MNYYFECGIVLPSEIELNETNGHGSAEVLSEAQYNFGMANRGASLAEIQAMQMNPPPDPPEPDTTPTEIERIEALEDAIFELIFGA